MDSRDYLLVVETANSQATMGKSPTGRFGFSHSALQTVCPLQVTPYWEISQVRQAIGGAFLRNRNQSDGFENVHLYAMLKSSTRLHRHSLNIPEPSTVPVLDSSGVLAKRYVQHTCVAVHFPGETHRSSNAPVTRQTDDQCRAELLCSEARCEFIECSGTV